MSKSAHLALGLALLVALTTGGAYAASKLGKNTVGPKQVQNGSLTGKEIKDDSLKGADIDESSLTLPKSLQGATGRQGVQGPIGPIGPTGHTGPIGPTGPAGSPPQRLPTGATLRGVWAVGDQAAVVGSFASGAFSFQIPLAVPPHGNIRAVGAPANSACPGSASQPEAAAGQLCLYTGEQMNVNSIQLCQPGAGICSATASDRQGFSVELQSTANNGLFVSQGTWAVTAP